MIGVIKAAWKDLRQGHFVYIARRISYKIIYELYALRGAERTLQQAHVLCLEIGDRHSVRVGYTAQDLMSYLAEQGWRLFRLESPTHLVEITPDYQPPDVESLVATRSVELLLQRLSGYRVQELGVQHSQAEQSPQPC